MREEEMMAVVDYVETPGILREIARKIVAREWISGEEGVILFSQGGLGFLGMLADYVRKVKNGDNASYIRNFHIEPTNICVNKCRFCSYSHHFSATQWELTIDQILEKVRVQEPDVNELHITGAVHPDRDIYYYGDLLVRIKAERPLLHLKAYSAVELDYMIGKSGMSIREGLEYLKSCGLASIPGGGAEIFDETVRREICGMKSSAKTWLAIHETAHELGIPSNATMLYGHMETYAQRIDHL